MPTKKIDSLSANVGAEHSLVDIAFEKVHRQKELLVLAFFYSISHVGILFIPHGIFWDDWVLYNNSTETILDIFKQTGDFLNFIGHMHTALLNIGVWVYKLLTFVLMFFSGIMLSNVLKQNGLLSKEMQLVLVLLFLILPINVARIALITFPYTLCYFLFFSAWSLMHKSRVIALVLFALSFNTQSLLVFYALPVLDMAYQQNYLSHPKKWAYFLKKNFEYILLPFLFFAIKVVFFPPYGDYQGYNQHFSLLKIPHVIGGQIVDLLKLHVNLASLVVLSPLAYYTFRAMNPYSSNSRPIIATRNSIWIATFGVATLIAGCFPYWILGLKPTFSEWTSRHQLLMPLGIAIILVGAYGALRRPFRESITAFVIALSISLNTGNYIDFFIDWEKQKQIVELLRKNPVLEEATLIIYEDTTEQYNAIDRTYRFYEWNGMMAEAFDDQSRFGISRGELHRYKSGGFDHYFTPAYKAASHQRSEAPITAIVKLSAENQSTLDLINPSWSMSVSSPDDQDQAFQSAP